MDYCDLKIYRSTCLCRKANIPETTLFFGKLDLNIFAVCYTELYTYKVPRVVPLGCCWLPVRKTEDVRISAQKYSPFLERLRTHAETPCRFKEQLGSFRNYYKMT